MPVYSYECTKCGTVFDEFRRYEERDDAPPHCSGASVRRVFTAPMVVSEEKVYPPYESPATGEWVRGGRRAHLEDLKKNNCRIKEPGETEEYMRKVASGELRREREARLAKTVEEAVNSTARDMGLLLGS